MNITKTKLTLTQLGGKEAVRNDEEIEYEIVETNNAKWLCGEILSREDVIGKCANLNRDRFDIKIVPDGYPSSITLTI